jgi:hypothetical protein
MDLTDSRQDSLDGGSALSESRYPHRTAQTQNKRTQTSMPRVGFELTIPVFKRAKTFHALHSAATVIGHFLSLVSKYSPDRPVFKYLQ